MQTTTDTLTVKGSVLLGGGVLGFLWAGNWGALIGFIIALVIAFKAD